GYGWKVLLPLTLPNLAVTGGVVLATQGRHGEGASGRRGDRGESYVESDTGHVGGVFASVQTPGDHPVSRAKTLPTATVAWAYYSVARSRWRRALCGLLPVCRGLPGGLYCLAGHTGHPWQTLSRVFPHQFLTLYFLWLLRRSLSHVCHPTD